MAHINRKFIDKHWLMFVLRGGLAVVFGLLTLFGHLNTFNIAISTVVIFLLIMGVVDAIGAFYSSVKKHGWLNSVIDALIDVAAAVCLLFFAQGDFVMFTIILAVYTLVSGVIDIFHGFLSTVDPTDRFIRVLAGVIGAVIGFVILNAGSFELMTFVRFFGAYLLIVGVSSMIYGIHNRAQDIEDRTARSESRKGVKSSAKKVAGHGARGGHGTRAGHGRGPVKKSGARAKKVQHRGRKS